MDVLTCNDARTELMTVVETQSAHTPWPGYRTRLTAGPVGTSQPTDKGEISAGDRE